MRVVGPGARPVVGVVDQNAEDARLMIWLTYLGIRRPADVAVANCVPAVPHRERHNPRIGAATVMDLRDGAGNAPTQDRRAEWVDFREVACPKGDDMIDTLDIHRGIIRRHTGRWREPHLNVAGLKLATEIVGPDAREVADVLAALDPVADQEEAHGPLFDSRKGLQPRRPDNRGLDTNGVNWRVAFEDHGDNLILTGGRPLCRCKDACER
jgi:hypothetical protein